MDKPNYNDVLRIFDNINDVIISFYVLYFDNMSLINDWQEEVISTSYIFSFSL